jgi:hypothetical protein
MESEYIDRMKQVADHFQKARRLLDQGPLDYYFAKLVEHSEALLNLSPFKDGDRACIIQEVSCPGDWSRTAKSLEIGAVGTIRGVDYSDGDFLLSFKPDLQFYQQGDRWIQGEDCYCYPLKAKYLGPIGSIEKQPPLTDEEIVALRSRLEEIL